MKNLAVAILIVLLFGCTVNPSFTIITPSSQSSRTSRTPTLVRTVTTVPRSVWKLNTSKTVFKSGESVAVWGTFNRETQASMHPPFYEVLVQDETSTNFSRLFGIQSPAPKFTLEKSSRHFTVEKVDATSAGITLLLHLRESGNVTIKVAVSAIFTDPNTPGDGFQGGFESEPLTLSINAQ